MDNGIDALQAIHVDDAASRIPLDFIVSLGRAAYHAEDSVPAGGQKVAKLGAQEPGPTADRNSKRLRAQLFMSAEVHLEAAGPKMKQPVEFALDAGAGEKLRDGSRRERPIDVVDVGRSAALSVRKSVSVDPTRERARYLFVAKERTGLEVRVPDLPVHGKRPPPDLQFHSATVGRTALAAEYPNIGPWRREALQRSRPHVPSEYLLTGVCEASLK